MKPIDDEEIARKAQQIVGSPRFVTTYLNNPAKMIEQTIAPDLAGRVLGTGKGEIKKARQRLEKEVQKQVADDPQLGWLEALEREKAAFLKDGMENPQRAFNTILLMSRTIFLVGIGLIIGAAVAAALGEDTLQKSLIGGLAGGGGLISTAFAVYTMSNEGIRRANGDNAQIRAILHSFATQTLILRRAEIHGLAGAKAAAEELQRVTDRAVELIETRTEPSHRNGAPAPTRPPQGAQ